jgi:hypothetical protein
MNLRNPPHEGYILCIDLEEATREKQKALFWRALSVATFQ